MKGKLVRIAFAAAFIMGPLSVASPAGAAPSNDAGGGTRQVLSAGTTRIHGQAPGKALNYGQPETRKQVPGEEAVPREDRPRADVQSDIFPSEPLPVPKVGSSSVEKTNPEVDFTFQGLNHFDQRTANGGNQFSLEPPDQGLCVGNGFTVEVVNSVIQVFDTNTGEAKTGVQDLNTFFGYKAAIDRSAYPRLNSIGAEVIDPQCLYDSDTNRFIVDITTLGVAPDFSFNGLNTIDVAVSNSGDPTGHWTIYHIPAQNDGTQGTPDHGCTLDGTKHGPCFQDYPHIGADKYGVYISTNEYDLFGPSYNAAQIFAFSKSELAHHPKKINVTLVANLQLAGTPGFTVWPATTPQGHYESDANGTEYFLSTIAGDGSETGNPTRTANKIGLWALTNTASLDSKSPDLHMSSQVVDSATYVYPPRANQKPGDVPLADCINDSSTPTPYGDGCWQIFFYPPEPAHDEVEYALDAGDTRMQQTWFVNGTLWGAAGTTVRVHGKDKAGIVWFKVDPSVDGQGEVSGQVANSGYLALADNNLTYPALAMTTDGQGVIAFTVTGADYYPSAGYATIDDQGNVGPIHILGKGKGPSDGFTGYKAFEYNFPRWGDYGAAVTDGSSIWLASESIEQTCSYAEYYPNPPDLSDFGTCGGTRTSLANWATRVSKLTP
jgi:hypothetical protein